MPVLFISCFHLIIFVLFFIFLLFYISQIWYNKGKYPYIIVSTPLPEGGC